METVCYSGGKSTLLYVSSLPLLSACLAHSRIGAKKAMSSLNTEPYRLLSYDLYKLNLLCVQRGGKIWKVGVWGLDALNKYGAS